jgi:hypothetical protein
MKRWLVAVAVVLLCASTAHAAGTIQLGLAGIGLPSGGTACFVDHIVGTYKTRPVVSCQQGESFFLNFRNLNDASKAYTPEIHWRTPSTNTSTTVVWTWACVAYPDGADVSEDGNQFSVSTAATASANAAQNQVNEDSTTAALNLIFNGLTLQCSSSNCAGAEVTCKVTLTTGIGGVGGSEHYYIGANIVTTD